MTNSSVRVVLAGGRYNHKHIAFHLNSLEGSIHTIVLDGSSFYSGDYLKSEVSQQVNYSYVHLPGTGLIERLNAGKDSIRDFETSTIVGVDDLIVDQSIFQIIDETFNSSNKKNSSLIRGFGPDLSYYPSSAEKKARFFLMPRRHPICGTSIDFIKYWSKLGEILSLSDGICRLFTMISSSGFFPFVYATYNTRLLLGHTESIIRAFNDANIEVQSCKAGILHEFTTVASAALLSEIYIANSIYRLGNYSIGSAGGDITYNYRTILDSSNDDVQQIYLFFKYYSSHMTDYCDIGSEFSDLLMAAYLLLANISKLALGFALNDNVLLNPKGNYQKLQLRELSCQALDRNAIEKYKNFISLWKE